MKRIFFIINCFSKGGGAEALLTLIVNNLNPQKYEIGVMEIIHDTIKKEPIHGDVYDLATERMSEERLLQSEAFKKADRIVAISDITMQSLLDLFPEHKDKFVMLCNGIDVESVRKKANEETCIKLEHPAILSIGRVEDNKNPSRLLNIFEKYLNRDPGAHLYYLGYGDQCELVQQKALEKGINQSVHLLGFPLALLEGVALGKPFVSSVIGGARLLANVAGCGKVTESDDEAVDALSYYIKKDKTIVEKACEDTIKCFNLESYITQIEELLDSL